METLIPSTVKHRELIAEPISWRLGKTGLIIRDNMGRQLCRLMMSEVAFENDERPVAEALVQDIAALIEQRTHIAAPIADKHK